jgi:maltodextrin utilization protein YvdJ
MLTLFSTLISFLMGGLPKILDFFQDRSDKKHELELAQMQIAREIEMRKLGFEAQERVENIHTQQIELETKSNEKLSLIAAQQAEMQAIYAHDTALNEGTSQWMKNFRASVRPAITYGFFFLLVAIDCALVFHGFTNNVSFEDMADQLWDDETQALFAAIISFHFGGRAFGK